MLQKLPTINAPIRLRIGANCAITVGTATPLCGVAQTARIAERMSPLRAGNALPLLCGGLAF